MELVRNSACGSGEPALERATEEEIKRRNLELQLEAWGDSEAFEERFMHLYNKANFKAQKGQREQSTEEKLAGGDARVIHLIDEVGPRMVRATVSTHVPSSWHQATVYMCTSESPIWIKSIFCGWAFVMVVFQLILTGVLLFGTSRPMCVSSDTCPVGLWCTGDYKDINRCLPCLQSYQEYCIGGTPESRVEIWENEAESDFSNPDELSQDDLCDACVIQTGSGADFIKWQDAQEQNVRNMREPGLDWVVLGFITLIVTFAVVHETRDALLCRIAVVQAKDWMSMFWGIGIGFIGIFRIFVTLPLMVWAVAETVFIYGSQSTVMILNSIAVVSIILLNVASYSFLTRDSVKREIREFGEVQLTNSDKWALSLSRWAYALSVAAFFIAKIVLENYLKDSDFGPKWINRSADYPYGFELVFYPFLVGPAVEALWSFFSDWRFMAIPGALIRIAGGWFVFSYYTYLLWDWYYREQSV